MDPVKNFAKVEVNTGYDASAISVVLSAGHGAKLPNPATDGAFNLVWWNSTDYPDPSDDPKKEIVRCTARATDTLTVTRAQEDTSASAKNTADKTYKMILGATAKTITDLTALTGTTKRLTATGLVNDSNKTFTFTEEPTYIIIRGVMYPKATGVYNWTWDTLTATLAVPVGSGGFIEGLVL